MSSLVFVFFYLLKWAKFSCQFSGNVLDGETDESGEDEVTGEVVASGLVGCVLVGSLVDRPHTLSTCGEEQSHRQTPVRLVITWNNPGGAVGATSINSETAPAQLRAHECKYLIQTEFLLEERMPFQVGNNYGAANFRVSDKENREHKNKKNGGISCWEGCHKNAEPHTAVVHIVGSTGWVIRAIATERQTVGSLDWRVACFERKSMTTHWLKSLWLVWQSAPQLAEV